MLKDNNQQYKRTTLVIPNDYFVRIVKKNLKERDIYKMTSHMAKDILLYNDRAIFWGLYNCIDSALEGTNIKFEQDINDNYIFFYNKKGK